MSLPQNRDQFQTFCLQALGAPVLEVNLAQEQIDQWIDYSLDYFARYHADGTEKQYYKHKIVEADFPDRVKDIRIINGGNGYSNTDTVTLTPVDGSGQDAMIDSLTTDVNGTITSFNVANNGAFYRLPPTLSITTSSGTGANVEVELGGWIALPENVIGVVNIFDLTNAITNISNMFSIQYQIALNEIWSLSSYSMVPYYTTIMHLNLIQQLLVGSQPVRYSRHRQQLYLDMSWDRVTSMETNYLIVECYQVVNPNEFPHVWRDGWLLQYATQQLKKQWGMNLKKYGNLEMPGRTVFNGQIYYDEAVAEIEKLEALVLDLSTPVSMYIG